MFEDMGSFLQDRDNQTVSRRDMLKMGLAGILASAVPLLGASEAQAYGRDGKWRVSFQQAHTGEKFSGVYRVGNTYIPDAFERLNYVLRDFRTGEVFPMDPRVIDVLSMLQSKTPGNRPFKLLSGYRSPKTNATLGRKSSGVAKNSFHMYGQALDIQCVDCGTKQLRDTALSLRAGGVGYYPRSGFVHVDTGKVRSW